MERWGGYTETERDGEGRQKKRGEIDRERDEEGRQRDR